MRRLGAQCRGYWSCVPVAASGLARKWGCRPLQRSRPLNNNDIQPNPRPPADGWTQAQAGSGVTTRRSGASMSKAAGVVLILGGLGLAAFAMSSEFAVRGSDAARRVEEAKITPAEAQIVEPLAVPRPQPVLRRAAAPRPEAVPSGSAPVIVTLAPRSGDAAPSRTA